MDQLHKRFTVDQVKVLLLGYSQGTMRRAEVEEMLHISKTRFFALLKAYHENPSSFSINYERATPARLSPAVEAAITEALLQEKKLIDDPQLPITNYNYTALRDRLKKKGITVSTTTITARAKKLACYRPHPKGQAHDRQGVTATIGALVQHDASLHLGSPFAQEKRILITSLDDYSRQILFGDSFLQESTWTHILAAQTLMQKYGLPLQYYVDNLRVFRFVQGRDSFWRKQVLQTDEVDPQWRQVLRLLGVDMIYALSAQAKGKIERPYRWLQDRIVRTCALEHIIAIEEGRAVLKEELERSNNHQVHSTTGEIPRIRFANAQETHQNLFRPFELPKPSTSSKDVFCLHETRVVNGYRRISLFNHEIDVPNVPLREEVELHLTPNTAKQLLEVRIWWNEKMVRSLHLPLSDFAVHF